jgi:hypothetical protein
VRILDRVILVAAALSRVLLITLWLVLALAVFGAVVAVYTNGANPW